MLCDSFHISLCPFLGAYLNFIS
ncbi:hypothetical protein [Plasmodium yoelii yoelii]|uniref:Uncharacterized protein n=1 Tax=Plasmodium yoelii yoelii TaxID=73239 RepID=Q7R976_PLAYO|nr:hypothetical protein [Plasmodium yoelii yoelii]